MNNNVKERPILFSEDMIRALLQEYSMPGQYKNQTRRTRGLNRFNNFPEYLKKRGWEIQDFIEEEPGLWLAVSNDESGEFPDDNFNPWVRCPYGKAGDRLWVRETFFEVYDDQFRPTGKYCYAATHQGYVHVLDEDGGIKINKDGTEASPWKSGIHMPRKAARILLELTEVRIERLLDITSQDARMEGIESVWHDEETDVCLWKDYSGKSNGYIFARTSYFSLWDKLKGAGSSKMNPWVWVIKFKILTINGDIK
ncbi:hypothetical protein CXU03_09635 [Akkermansia muciniphila]|uniref:hypothetical protein n=1 Tax=Akkermansia muciniphila TaxID=239935 RepID=UPI000C9CE54F|nr:hypothetical protein [Akkermansia muciniphila]PNC87500.1 hypothetical protein CXU03_09635 [Akkermansia muciniphila]